MKNWWKIVVGVGILAGGVWLYRYIVTPAPGVAVVDLGREHVSLEEVEKTTYTSNPPTSGPHYEVASKPGMYDAITDTEACKTLQKQLTDLAMGKKLWKLIVVPRPELDTTIALTAWDRIDKLDDFDAKRIERFIDYWRDRGPEKTME